MKSLGLTDAALARELWQLWTCHLVHWSFGHFAANVIALLPPLFALPARFRRQLIAWAAVVAPVVSLVLLAGGLEGEYRGASGLVAGLWTFAGIMTMRAGERRIGIILMLAIMAKLIAEAIGIVPARSAVFETLAVVHFAGALCGALTGLVWPIGRRSGVVSDFRRYGARAAASR